MYVYIKLSFFCKERKGEGEDDNEPGASKHIPNHPTTPTFQAQLSALSESSHSAQYCISQKNTQNSEKLCNTRPEFASSPKLKKVHKLLVEAEEDRKLHSASDKSSSCCCCCCFFPCCCCALSSVFIAGSKGSKLDSTGSCCKASRKDEREKKQKSFSLQRAMIIAAHLHSSSFISRSPLGCEQYQQANYILHILKYYQLLLLLLQQQTHQSLILPPPFLFLFLFSPNNAANQCYERASERASPKCSS